MQPTINTYWHDGRYPHLEVEYREDGICLTTFRILPWKKGLYCSKKRFQGIPEPNRMEELPFSIADFPLNQATKAWLSTFPPFILKRMLIEGWRYDYCELLALCNHHYYLQLEETNQALSVMVHHYIQRKRLGFSCYADMAREKRINLLRQIGINGTKSNLKLLDKLAPTVFLLIGSTHLQRVYSQTMKMSLTMLQLSLMCEGKLNSSLLDDIVHLNTVEQNRLLSGLLILERKLQKTLAEALSNIKSIHALERLIDYAERVPDFVQYQKPPVPEISGITAIRTSLELHQEGKTMHHCVGSLWRTPMRGKDYFYHIQKGGGQGYTLHISTEEGKDLWQIKELKGKNNFSPTEEISDLVKDWLSAHQKK